MNIQLAADAARIRHDGSPSPSGGSGQRDSGTVHYESHIPAGTIAELERRGHRMQPTKQFMGGYQGIAIDWDKKTLQGATESRIDGHALGLD